MSTRKSLAWTYSERFLGKGIHFFSSIIVARLLTPDEIGVFALAVAANALIAAFRDFGTGSYLIREEKLNDDKIRTVFGLAIVIQWILGIAILLARDYIAALYDTPGIADVMLLLSVSFFLTPFGQPANSLLTREMRFDLLHHVALLSGLTQAVVSVTLAFLGFSYMALAWGMIAGNVTRMALLLGIKSDHIKLMPGFRYWREVLHFGGFLTAASILQTVGGQGIKFVLGGLIRPGAVALFERAEQLPYMGRQIILGPLGHVLLPTFSRNIREGQSIGPAVTKVVAGSTVLIWPAFLTLGLMAESVVVFLFGENWRVAGEILPYVLIAHALVVSMPPANEILTPYGRVRRVFFLHSIMTPANLLLTAIGALHSLEMFAMLRPIYGVVSAVAIYLAIRPLWQVRGADIRMNYAKAATIALISAIPAVLVRFHYGTDIPPIWIFVVPVLAAFLWMGALALFRHPLMGEMSLLARQIPLLRATPLARHSDHRNETK